MREIAWWKKRAVGIAESFFPHPKEWRFEGLDCDLDNLDAKTLTAFLSAKVSVPPSCLQAWEARIGKLPNDIGERYNARLLTPRDWASHFKNVLHRNLLVRSKTDGGPCRCCNFDREDLIHFGRCERAGQIFKELAGMAEVPQLTEEQWDRFTLFALTPAEKLPEGWVNLHLLLWKQLIGLLVQIELEGEKFAVSKVWAPTWIRFERKVLALKEHVDRRLRRAESRGEQPPQVSKISRCILPLAEFNDEGSLVWNKQIVDKIKKLAGLDKNEKRTQVTDGSAES